MIGVYDYTVILTYLSAISAGLGILFSLSGDGHPYVGVFFLLFSGLCDAFDGRVARRKKDRTEYSRKFGVQIDSLSDILAFGVLPVCIGTAMIRVCPLFNELMNGVAKTGKERLNVFCLYGIMLFYLVMGVTRLAHYNVTEDERQQTEEGNRRSFTGVPITAAAVVFPTVLLFQYLLEQDITLVYFMVMMLLAVAFVVKIRIPKPGFRGIMIMVGIGAAEFIFLMIRLLM